MTAVQNVRLTKFRSKCHLCGYTMPVGTSYVRYEHKAVHATCAPREYHAAETYATYAGVIAFERELAAMRKPNA